MSKNILFISEQKLKDSSMLSDNIDPKSLRPTVKMTQDMYIHPLLGSALYNKLQELVQSGTVAGDYKILMDEYITDTLVWYTLTEMPVPLQYKLVNKGVITRTGEAIQTISFAEVQNIVDYCRNKAEWYAQRCIQYLCANQDKYPEYKATEQPADGIYPDITQYTCGIDLGPVRRDKHTFDRRYQGK
ncbi:hypothetical protein [Chitinophaga sp. sic0106]|uniref:DUF6712 family protein n=1 Tax=Chitinophaga sp. sic0106 TaxID=2854785 RepID=UPI001C447B1D|nr:hypothetical protein [Chitinophaga sp. sic0106]MBV7534045.1 hypothetical protein [Chitinophaga sp. sic0106]